MLRTQNSTVSGRVGDLIEGGLVKYILDERGVPQRKPSTITGMRVQMLRANDVFEVSVAQMKTHEVKSELNPDDLKVQRDLF